MKGRAAISWGIVAGSDLLADVILENGLEFSLKTSLANTIIATQGKIITTDLHFNPAKIKNGRSYFTTMTGVAYFSGGTILTYKDDALANDNTGQIILSGLDLRIAKAIGGSKVTLKQQGNALSFLNFKTG